VSSRFALLVAACLASACHIPPLLASYSLDHSQKVELVMGLSGMSVHRNRQSLGAHPLIDPASLVWSPNGQYVAYAARRRDGWHLVINGKVLDARWDGLLTPSLHITNTGQATAVWRREEKLFVVHGAITYGPYDGVTALQLDQDDMHVAFIARKGSQAFAVLDGLERGPYESIAELRLSRSGGKLAVVVRRNQRWWVIYEGTEFAHDSIAGLVFSEADQRLVYVARDQGVERVIERQVPLSTPQAGPAFSRIDWRTLLAAAERPSLAYVAEHDRQQFVVTDTQAGPGYDFVRELVRSGNRIGYIGRRTKQEQAIVDGVPGPWFDQVGGLVIASGASAFSRYAYLGRRGDSVWLITGNAEQRIKWGLAGSLAICESGEHVALLGGIDAGALQLIIDGQAIKQFDADEPESVRRTWGPMGVRYWIETELRPRCRGSEGR
jgi:hypothetical protein